MKHSSLTSLGFGTHKHHHKWKVSCPFLPYTPNPTTFNQHNASQRNGPPVSTHQRVQWHTWRGFLSTRNLTINIHTSNGLPQDPTLSICCLPWSSSYLWKSWVCWSLVNSFLPNVTPWLLLLSATYLRFDTLHILLSSSNYNSAHFSLLFCRWLDLLALTGRILKYIQC